MKQRVQGKFHLKYHEQNVEVFLSNRKDCASLSEAWKRMEIKYHTYTIKEKKKSIYT